MQLSGLKREKTTYKEVVREAFVERHDAVEMRDLRAGQANFQCFEVCQQVLDFAAADDGEHVRGLLHEIRNSH
jgi:hypothetical protein